MMAAVCSCKGDLSSSKVVELLIQTAEEPVRPKAGGALKPWDRNVMVSQNLLSIFVN